MQPYVPWYIGGPLFALCVVALYWLTNQRLGVSGSYLHISKIVMRRPGAQAWRIWFFAGVLLGAGGAAAANGVFAEGGYGHLAEVLPMSALVPVLLVGGMLIGYGARFAGGCTSSHGISGCSSLSGGSFVTTAVFFSTAVVVTWLLHLFSGGAL
ncbi:MAG: YeeE/YedE family protein [Nitriliruptorales bacterium]|nr:YeeE/YedE family protein [Nitriliruptorales bacterium]